MAEFEELHELQPVLYSPKAGDVIVLKSAQRLTPQQLERIAEMKRRVFGKDIKMVVLEELDIEILRRVPE